VVLLESGSVWEQQQLGHRAVSPCSADSIDDEFKTSTGSNSIIKIVWRRELMEWVSMAE